MLFFNIGRIIFVFYVYYKLIYFVIFVWFSELVRCIIVVSLVMKISSDFRFVFSEGLIFVICLIILSKSFFG